MSEIVRIKASGAVGIVRATYINTATNEELLEVQIVGRATGPRSFVKRADVETVELRNIDYAIFASVMLCVKELRNSVGITMSYNAAAALRGVEKAIAPFVGEE